MKIINKKAKFNYEIVDSVEAGIVLSGEEVKAIRLNKVDFTGSYVKIIGAEMVVINLHIGVLSGDTRKTRKLLLNKIEIVSMATKVKQQKLTFIPLSLYNKGRLIKLEVALAKGKKAHEKRAQIKQKDIERDLVQELNPKLNQ